MTWTTEHWARIEALFLAAAQVPESERCAFVRAQCGDDVSLCREVRRLLAADASAAADPLLDRGVAVALHGADPLLGTRVGAFELVERIADGGMGSVYRARRAEADFAQEVAVKVLRLGLSTPTMRERFARERRTLARLVHANVARLLDGGTTAHGVPFIVMEFVEGVAIDRFADAAKLPLRARLQLFTAVCHAVQFAHQNLVVHLDLKPSNVLVDQRGVPKLLDFGVAGLLEDLTGGDAVAAATRSRPLTPEYASPEQLRGDAVGTAADVYALGVVLYELLTGQRPFARSGNDLALARTVCDTEARPASATFQPGGADATPTAVARAAARGGQPSDMAKHLRGDLDRIVAKAMAKEPVQRYASCQALADDVDRWLRGFPVAARPLGWCRRSGRFVRRHAWAVGAAIAVLASLLAGLAATTHWANVASAERDAAAAAHRRSEHEAAHARVEALSNHVVAEFLGDTFLSASRLADPGERSRVMAMIEHRAEQVRRQHAGDPHLSANLLHALGRACTAIDAFEAADALLREAAAIRDEHFGRQSLEAALSLLGLGQLAYRRGDFAGAANALREAYRLHHECPTGVHTDVAQAANDLAAAERALGNVERARELHQEALALRRESGDALLIAESLNNLANSEADFAAARGHLEEALRLRTDVLGEHDPLTIQCEANLGALCVSQGQFEAAVPRLQHAVAASRELGALGNDALAVVARSLAYALLRVDRVDEAAAAVREALAVDEARFGRNHPRVAAGLEVRAAVEERRAEWSAAVATWREVVRVREVALPPGHRSTTLARQSLGSALLQAGDAAAALSLLREVVAALAAPGERAGADVAAARVALALACERTGAIADAERELRAAVAAVDATPVPAATAAAIRAHLRAFLERHGREKPTAGK